MSGLEVRQLRILLILTAVNPVALLDARRLVGVRRHVRSIRMLGEGAGVLFDYAGEVRKPCVDIVTFNNRRPELILSFIHGILGSNLSLLPHAVLTSILPEGHSVLLLLCLDRELKSTDVGWMWTRVKRVTKLRRLLSDDLRLG